MQIRTYTEKSNARRAARAAGVDPNLVIETEDGFTFAPPAETETNGNDQQQHDNGSDPDASAARMKAAHAAADTTLGDQVDMSAAEADDNIPAFCKIPAEERKAAWIKNPPRAAVTKQETDMAKAKTPKRRKGSKELRTSGGDKTAKLLSMLKGKGSTVEAMTKALDWLPHTLRARISGLAKPKSKGGEGLKIERERTDGVTSYRILS